MDVSQLTSAEVADLLKREKIISEKGIGLIIENEVDGEALLLLETDKDFEDIGIKVGDRVKLRRFIAKYKTAEQLPVATSSNDQSVRDSCYFVCDIIICSFSRGYLLLKQKILP